jgi:GT2 family glycosyltransferase
MMDVAIVNHNTCEHLSACLATVRRELPTEVVVVDNASTDGSPAMVQRDYPWVRLYANPANPGYGAAANQAVAACPSNYVLLLNSDTRLQPGTLRALHNYLDRHLKAAIVGPRLLNPDGSLQPSCYPYPTPFHVFLEESTLIRLIRRTPGLRNQFQRTWSHTQPRSVPWVLGAALAIRREPFEAAGGFDESFFLYAEEIDLCYRLGTAGWETHFTPDATVVHVGGASTRQRRADMALQFFRSLAHFYRRHYSGLRLAQLIVIMKTLALARLLRDTAHFHLTLDRRQRAGIAENRAAWQHILLDERMGN